jgi:hypothetical protein
MQFICLSIGILLQRTGFGIRHRDPGIVSYADIASDFAVARSAGMGLPRSPIALAAALSTAL